MVLELHIWGPAFDLPSIDAQCLAAVLYLRQCLRHDDWVLVPSTEPRVGPIGELPALRDGKIWVAGFTNIVDYLGETSNGDCNLDKDLSPQQQADRTALAAFITSRGQPLLGLCLYVSSDNYLNCTRRALADILSWPNSWTLPHQLREQAKKRSEHLGLSSLDVDTAQEDENKKENAGLTAQIPKSLRRPKRTITSLLGGNQQRNRFRLEAVTEDFFEPLSNMLGDKKWLLGEQASSADCLAIGYLVLMQTLHLQHGWLGESLRTKHTRLDDWARKQATKAIGPPVDVALVLGQKPGLANSGLTLPWRAPRSRSFSQICHEALEACVGSVPVIGSFYSVSESSYTHAKGGDRYQEKHLQLVRLQQRREMYLEILTSTISMTGLLAWLLHEGILRLPRWNRPAPTRTQFGEAGALLGLV